MRRVLIVVVIVAVVAGAWFAYQNYVLPDQGTESEATSEAESVDDLGNVIWYPLAA